MKVKHNLTVHATCPEDGSDDVYEVTVRTREVIAVEELLDAVKDLTSEPIYQEEFTRQLAQYFDARVTTVGTHSGVLTTCRAD